MNKQKLLYDESNYILVKADSFKGNVGTKYYDFKHDTLRKMQIEFDADGKIMAKIFLHQGKLDGRCEMYDTNGKVMSMDSFSNGVKLLSKKYYGEDTSLKIFKDGKLVPFH